VRPAPSGSQEWASEAPVQRRAPGLPATESYPASNSLIRTLMRSTRDLISLASWSLSAWLRCFGFPLFRSSNAPASRDLSSLSIVSDLRGAILCADLTRAKGCNESSEAPLSSFGRLAAPESFRPAYRRYVAVQYTIICDGCGRFVASSRSSVRAARAEAQMNRGANHGPDGDQCVSCRKKRLAELSDRAKSGGRGAAHSIPGRRSNWD
jgi:hypothetical protein